MTITTLTQPARRWPTSTGTMKLLKICKWPATGIWGQRGRHGRHQCRHISMSDQSHRSDRSHMSGISHRARQRGGRQVHRRYDQSEGVTDVCIDPSTLKSTKSSLSATHIGFKTGSTAKYSPATICRTTLMGYYCPKTAWNKSSAQLQEIIITQYNINLVLKRFGQNAVGAIEKEVRQLVTMESLEPYKTKELIKEDHRAVMAYLMFLKEK